MASASASLCAHDNGLMCISRTAVLRKVSFGTGQGWKALESPGQGNYPVRSAKLKPLPWLGRWLGQGKGGMAL